nr:hypothetical protein [Myxococcota bacterium]
MAKIWILHRDSRWRAALLRLLGESDVLAGDPCAPGGFGEAAPPDVVLLGLGGDFEAELEFVHRHMGRAGRAAWLVLAPPAELGRARQLFDALPAPVIPATSDPRELRRRMRSTLALRGTTSLGQRLRRGSLQDRFARWLAGLELDGLLEATDPARAALPVLVRGEPGTGRGLLVRYLHSVASGEPPGGLAVLRGAAGADAAALLAGLDWEVGPSPGTGPATLWLAEVDRLDGATQRQVCDWIEHGPPGPLAAPRIRWMATAGDDPARLDPHLDARLADALAGIELRLPPLRERPDFDELVHATIADWCRRHALRPRSFSHEALAALRDHPWPRNLPELDAVVARTLAATSEDPVPASALRFETPPASGGEAEARSEP